MQLYQSPYLIVEQNQVYHYQINTWLPATEDFDDATFQAEASQQTKAALAHRPKAFLSDARDFLFPIHPDLRAWISDHIFRDMRTAGVEKLALLISSDVITQLGIEQLVDDDPVKGFMTQYFDDKDKAEAWIICD